MGTCRAADPCTSKTRVSQPSLYFVPTSPYVPKNKQQNNKKPTCRWTNKKPQWWNNVFPTQEHKGCASWSLLHCQAIPVPFRRLLPFRCLKRNANCTNRCNSSFFIFENCWCLLDFKAKSFLTFNTLQITEKCKYRFAPPSTALFTHSMNRELWLISPEGENNRIFWATALNPPNYSQPTLLFLTVKE